MKKHILLITFIFIFKSVMAQVTGSFTVEGSFDRFYPVTFHDYGWLFQGAAKVQITRFDVHQNSSTRGSLFSEFVYHTSQWGHGANFIKADIKQTQNLFISDIPFIAGWQDATLGNSSAKIIIWLRGGGTTYQYNSLYENIITVYDGVVNPLPYHEPNGADHDCKSTVDEYVNHNGTTSLSAYYPANKNNYFEGNVGIGTTTPNAKLAVNGKIRAHEIKVEIANWPDFVFAKDYKLPSLKEVENHIKAKGHLPDIPTAAEVKTNGIDLGAINAKLLQKIEELTLYLIEMKKENEVQRIKSENQSKKLLMEIRDLKLRFD